MGLKLHLLNAMLFTDTFLFLILRLSPLHLPFHLPFTHPPFLSWRTCISRVGVRDSTNGSRFPRPEVVFGHFWDNLSAEIRRNRKEVNPIRGQTFTSERLSSRDGQTAGSLPTSLFTSFLTSSFTSSLTSFLPHFLLNFFPSFTSSLTYSFTYFLTYFPHFLLPSVFISFTSLHFLLFIRISEKNLSLGNRQR